MTREPGDEVVRVVPGPENRREALVKLVDLRLASLRERLELLDPAAAARIDVLLETVEARRDQLASTGDDDTAYAVLADLVDVADAIEEDVQDELVREHHDALRGADRGLRRWRVRLEQARVQAALGRMDLRDEAAALRRRADDTWHQVVDELVRVGDDTRQLAGDVAHDAARVANDLRDLVVRSVDGMRKEEGQ